MARCRFACLLFFGPLLAFGAEQSRVHDLVIHHGVVYGGSGQPGKPGEVAIDGDRIGYVGPGRGSKGRKEIDAKSPACHGMVEARCGCHIRMTRRTNTSDLASV